MTSPTPKLSIGLPVYNGENYLAEALDTLLAQSFEDFEVMISDNASTDRTQEICEAYARRDARIRYARLSENRGAAYNYNRVFEETSAPYFKWAAHDDLCEPTFLERCVEALDSAGADTVLSYTAAVTIDGEGAPIVPDPYASGDFLRPQSDFAPARLVHTLRKMSMVNAVFGVIRRDALRKTRLIGPFVASDYVLMVELAMLGRFTRLDEPLLLRRKHPEGSRHEANPTLADVAAWFHGGDRKAPVLSPRLRLTLEYLRSTSSAELPLATRLACTAVVLPTLAERRLRVTAGRWRRRLLRREDALA
ncbi:MAG: glycosyltransferase family 2 protein [Pseudomonadota bacterium]